MSSRVAWIALVVSLVLVGGRTLLAAQSAFQPGGTQSQRTANRKQDMLVFDAIQGDSLIRAATSAGRNPFQPPAVQVVVKPAPKKATPEPPPAPVVPPRVVLLMQDGSSTVVQIEVEGESSGRMTVGSSFHGWTITSITDKGILVTNGSSTFNLPRPQ